MQDHLEELVSLHSKLIQRYSKKLVGLFVDQLTFCFFIGGMSIFPGIPGFKNWMVLIGRNPKAFSESLNHIFSLLPYYDESMKLDLNIVEIDQIRKINALDWKSISPFIFGRIFELTLETEDRAKLGAHYTPEEDIRDLIEPVFLSELRSEVERCRTTLLEGGIIDPDLIPGLLSRIRSIRILDPAGGTGNFLLICLWSLLDLENELIKLTDGFYGTIPCVTERQLYGIEKDPRAFRLMRVVLWLGYIQWMKKNFCEDVQINPFSIPKPWNFLNCDAILDLDDSALPREREWPEVDYIIGNPPYLGASRMRQLLGDEYSDKLNWVFNNRVPGSADFGAYWLEKARDMIDREKVKAAGFVISRSIKQEWSRPVLDRINQSGKIYFAISDRVWEGKEADIHVSLIGFTGPNYSGDLILDGQVVSVIHSNLSSHHNISELKRVKKGEYKCIFGIGDVLENSIDEGAALELIRNLSSYDLNPIRPFVGGRDLVQGSSNRWTTWNLNDLTKIGMKFTGRRFLVTSRVSKYCVFLWLDSVILPDRGVAVWDVDDDYLMGILQSQVHRVWTLANCRWRGERRDYQTPSCFKSFVFPCVDDFLVEGIRKAAAHLNALRDEWLYPEGLIKREYIKFCSFKNGPWQHYSVGEFEGSLINVSYPLIRPINSVAEKILSKRTVTGLYNDNPSWLQEAHRELDALVLMAYGWEDGVSDKEIISRLRLLNIGKSDGQA